VRRRGNIAALGGKFQRETFVGELIEPDTGRDGNGPRGRGARAPGLRSRGGLRVEFPARIDEVVECLLRIEHPDQPELLDADTQARLNLDHLHENFPVGLVIDRDPASRAASGEKYLHAKTVEYGLAGGILDGLLC
jgi:hypothetical protein